MNTLLHVFEAYTELYRVSGDEKVRRRLLWIMNVFAEKVYNPKLHRQEVFFDKHYNTILNLHSYGHDIEASWLFWEAALAVGDALDDFDVLRHDGDTITLRVDPEDEVGCLNFSAGGGGGGVAAAAAVSAAALPTAWRHWFLATSKPRFTTRTLPSLWRW